MVLIEKFAMMAHTELSHFVLDVRKTSKTSSFFHHLYQILVFQLLGDVQSVLHELTKANILNYLKVTLWQMKE